MISRRKGREFALQALYASEVGDISLDKAAAESLGSDEPVSGEMREYGMRLAHAARKRAEEIDALIAANSERCAAEL